MGRRSIDMCWPMHPVPRVGIFKLKLAAHLAVGSFKDGDSFGDSVGDFQSATETHCALPIGTIHVSM